MIGVIMAGGRGTRMGMDGEKLLLPFKKPIVLHVADALRESGCISKVMAATSPHAPRTRDLLQEHGIEIVDTDGAGYVKDLNQVLRGIDDVVLVVSGDLPLLDGDIIQRIAGCHDPQKTWTGILVTEGLLGTVGTRSEYSMIYNDRKCHPTGISIIDSRRISSIDSVSEDYVIVDDRRVALNLNTKDDYGLLGVS